LSQTGVAVTQRYGKVKIEAVAKIPDVSLKLDSNVGPFVVPIWNSHIGEIPPAEYVWNHLQDAKAKITDLWAKMIEFWFVSRTGPPTSYGEIGSVGVARSQCSRFLQRRDSTLVACELTTEAFRLYRAGQPWDGVLIAPDQDAIGKDCRVRSKKTANPNNFTTFVRLVPTRAFQPDQQTDASWITGVTMRSFVAAALGDAEHAFFDNLLEKVSDVNEIPKLIFVLKRIANVGLIFEGNRLVAGDVLDADQLEAGGIMVHEDAGATAAPYTTELARLFQQSCPQLTKYDFILHDGATTCLFACPPLGLYTHGYEIEAVEPVVRFYISKLFQLWSDGAKCTPKQKQFFNRHKAAWAERGTKFMKFKIVK